MSATSIRQKMKIVDDTGDSGKNTAIRFDIGDCHWRRDTPMYTFVATGDRSISFDNIMAKFGKPPDCFAGFFICTFYLLSPVSVIER